MKDYKELIQKIKKSSNVFLMGHKNIDLDSFGACLGMYNLVTLFKHKAYLILSEEKKETSILKSLEHIKSLKCNIGPLSTYKDKINDKSLLIVLDTSDIERVNDLKIIPLIKNIFIIDHHLHKEEIEYPSIINTEESSTCEMITKIFISRKKKIHPKVADVMLGGIDLDTNGYSKKVSSDTFDCSSFLIKNGGSVKSSCNLSKTKFKEYLKIQSIISKVEFYKKKYGIILCDAKDKMEKEELAIIADTLLKFDNIEASFAIGNINKDTVAVSSRSIKLNIAKIMEKLGGGGHLTTAACEVKNTSINEIEKFIKGELK